jgi:hypothetical protein
VLDIEALQVQVWTLEHLSASLSNRTVCLGLSDHLAVGRLAATRVPLMVQEWAAGRQIRMLHSAEVV